MLILITIGWTISNIFLLCERAKVRRLRRTVDALEGELGRYRENLEDLNESLTEESESLMKLK